DKYYIPEYKIISFFKALEKNEDLIEPLVQFLEDARSETDNLYPDEFLIYLLIFRSFFLITTNQESICQLYFKNRRRLYQHPAELTSRLLSEYED
ncbi:MAG: hypothetical protein ACTSPY_18180, partial [Candidatus Helarchaeota archaeon]